MSIHLSNDRLPQTFLHHQPFWMAVGCLLMGDNTWSNVKAEFWSIRAAAHNDPFWFALECPPHLHQFVSAWLQEPPQTAEELAELPGVTQLIVDSWLVFVDCRLDIEPDDKDLRSFTDEINTHQRWASSGLHD